MLLYRGTETTKLGGDSTLMHFGTINAAAHRIESMFNAQSLIMFDAEADRFTVTDKRTGISKVETIDQRLIEFSKFFESHTISEFEVDIHSSLRVNDCWQDDPIGSGAMELFTGNTTLTGRQLIELEHLFSPFKRIIYPDHVHGLLSRNKIKEVIKASKSNSIFKLELKKRKDRLVAIGSFHKDEMYHEAVWVDLTLKLRLWAMKNNFDSFVYKNDGEGGGSDSYVALMANQAKDSKRKLKFDSQAYIETISPIFKDYVKQQFNQIKSHELRYSIPKMLYMFWSGKNPSDFIVTQ